MPQSQVVLGVIDQQEEEEMELEMLLIVIVAGMSLFMRLHYTCAPKHNWLHANGLIST